MTLFIFGLLIAATWIYFRMRRDERKRAVRIEKIATIQLRPYAWRRK